MKKPANKTREHNSDREFAVVLEKIYAEFKTFGEGLAGIKDKLDSTMGMVAKNMEDITMLNIRSDVVKNDVTKINGKLAQIEEDIRIIKNDTRSIKEDIKVFDKRLTHLETVK